MADEFEGEVMVWLLEDDCAVLRAFEGRSNFRTYISIVVQRMAIDYANHLWGKWRPSAEAKRRGAVAVDLERLLHRDGRTLEEAVTFLRVWHKGVSLASLQALEAKLPPRQPRPRFSALDDIEEPAPSQAPEPNERLLSEERQRAAQEVSGVIAPILAGLAAQDRLILNLHFVRGMTFAQIARAQRLEQKLLYRRIDGIKNEIKRTLENAGFQWSDIADLIGRDEAFLHFDIGNPDPRPSKPDDESTGPDKEEP